jgi:uncharacterized membrane protein YciS (DUF1049 family)
MFTTDRKTRPLNDQDRTWHLDITKRTGEPHASGRVIRMNSTYLEMVDGFYSNRGMMSVVGILAISLISWFIASLWESIVVNNYLNAEWDRHDEAAMLWASIPLTLFAAIFVVGFTHFSRVIGEWFRYTHYPMRFNRANRKVYVFRGDGSVLEAPWDEVYFTLRVNARVAGTRIMNICGLVLKDPQTVQEMFVFGYASPSEEDCRRHWEFIRRYMEEGPRAVEHADGMGLYLPIADRKETLRQGWVALVSNDAWNPVFKWLMLPFHVLFFIGRLVCRATSKVPLWPTDIEAECRIEPDDHYVRDSRTSPVGYQ